MTRNRTAPPLAVLTLSVLALALAAPAAQAQGYTLTDVADFSGTALSNPNGHLLDVGGTLYGTTYAGGANNTGTLFSFNPATGALTDLADFTGANGEYPEAGLTDVGGLLYGTTSSGGANDFPNGDGTVFSFDPTNSKLTTLASFNDTNGAGPAGGLLDVGGTLYGTASEGGANSSLIGGGTVFSFSPATNQITDLFDFNGTDGAYPRSGLINVNGTLYGTTFYGGTNLEGTVFSFNPATQGLMSFAPFLPVLADGQYPLRGVTDVNGFLYGTTSRGGANSIGTVFVFNPNTGTITKFVDFTGPNGVFPEGDLTAVSGTLYGTAGGGTNNVGTVFTFSPATNTITDVAAFNSMTGYFPAGGLTNVNGILYGTTSSGGANSVGTVFALRPNAAVPEPSSFALLALGLLPASLLAARRRRA